ncbi:hypothetical protein GCM10025857_12250 [Alicyclobacillus contaminans]|nr:hypothetical protein GCM10025857_12250 [Alicyclobacillus contaminans]
MALEYALKPVLAVLGATVLEKSVFGLETQFSRLDSLDGYEVAPDLEPRLAEAAEHLVQQVNPVLLRAATH